MVAQHLKKIGYLSVDFVGGFNDLTFVVQRDA